MLTKFKQTRKTKEIVEKVHAYNNQTNTDLVSIGKDIYDLSTLLNNEITAIEKKLRRSIIIKTSLDYNKLVFSDLALNNKIIECNYKANFSSKKALFDLEIYKKIKDEVEKKYQDALKTDSYLISLKNRFHSVLSLYTNSNYKQITRSSKSKYDSLPFEKQLEMFSSDTFFTLQIEDVKELCQAVANSYCNKMKIKNLPLIFLEDKKDFSLGSYNSFGNYIHINYNYIKIISSLKKLNSKNCLIQYKLLSTIIHECRHSYQATNTSKNMDIKYVSNAMKINSHYMKRIFYVNDPYPEDPHPGYYSRLHELDAFNASNKVLIDMSKLDIKNAKEIEDFAIFDLQKDYKAKNSVIKEMVDLVNNHGLTQNISKCIYENLKFLNLTSFKYIEYNNLDKIDYIKTVENCVENLNTTKLNNALKLEAYYRTKMFETLFNRDKYLEEYAEKYNMQKNEYETMLENKFEHENEEIKSVIQNENEMV